MASKSDKVSPLSQSFRSVAGLPERTDDKPHDYGSGEPELTRYTEPEGGYGGKDGIANTGAINATEETKRVERDETLTPEFVQEQAEEASAAEELSAKSGQEPPTAAEAVTSTDATEAQAEAADKPAKKAAAKKGSK